MADIRRATGDINPVNFIKPGVQDDSAATLVKGATVIGAAGFELDRRLAKERFGQAIENLRTQFITSQAPDMGDDDPDVGEALAGVDARSLRDFEKVLGQQDMAVEQGRMSNEAFRIRAERLYRVAISKRPGLANEFRSVAAQYLGMDVVGATVDEIMRMRAEEDAAKAGAAKTVQEQLEESQKFQRQLYVEMGIPGAEAVIPGTPQAAEFFANHVGIFAERQAAATKLKATQQVVDQNKAEGTINRSANAANYNARIGALVQEWPMAVNEVLGELEAQGLLNDPNAVEAAALSLIAKYDNAVGELDAAFTEDDLPAEYRATQRERYSFLKGKLEKLISGERNANWTGNMVATMKNSGTISMLQNEDLSNAVAISNLFSDGQIAERILKDITPGLTVAISNIVTDKGTVEANTRYGAPSVRTLIGAIWPRADAKPAPEDVQKGVTGFGRALTSFYLADSVHFKPALFSKDGTKEGVLAHMNNHAKVIVPTMNEQQRQDISSAMGGAVVNSINILTQRLVAKAPTVWEKLDKKVFTPDGKGQVFKPVKGAQLTKLEEQALAEFNRQANVRLVTDAMKAYSGMQSETEVWKFIASLYPDVKEAQKVAKTDKPKERETVKPTKGAGSQWWRM